MGDCKIGWRIREYFQSHFIDNKPHPFQTLRAQSFEELSISEDWFSSLLLLGITRDLELGGKPYFIFGGRIDKTLSELNDRMKSKKPIDAWEYDSISSILLSDKKSKSLEILRDYGMRNISQMPNPTRAAFYFLEQALQNEIEL